jgi:hypothetical protein
MRRPNGKSPLCGFGEIVARGHKFLPVWSTIGSIAENENENYHVTTGRPQVCTGANRRATPVASSVWTTHTTARTEEEA